MHRRHVVKPAPVLWDDRPVHGKAFSGKRLCFFALAVLTGGGCMAAAFVEVVQEVGQIIFHYATANPEHTLTELPAKFLEMGVVKEDVQEHFFSMKGGNERKSGFVQWMGPTNISEPSWGFEQDKPIPSAQIYNPPLIDGDGNIYISPRSNRLYSLAPDGSLRWSIMAGKEPNWTIRLMPKISSPVLAGRYLYIADGSAYLLKIKKDTGEVKWRMRYTWQDEGDAHLKGLTYHNGTLIMHGWCSEALASLCKFTITAVDAVDGHVLWKILDPGDTPNDPKQMVWQDYVVMMFDKAELRCWDIRTGERKWSSYLIPNPDDLPEGEVAKGGSVVADPYGTLYATALHQEMLKDYKIDTTLIAAVDIRTGKTLWERRFFNETWSSRPAVFVASNRPLVSLQLGRHAPAMWEGQTVEEWSDYHRQKLGIKKGKGFKAPGEWSLKGSIHALDTRTGRTIWNFTPEALRNYHPAGSNMRKGVCWCDHWSDPAVGGDGTFYIGRMNGMFYALHGATGRMRSSYNMMSGMIGSPAISPGMLVVSACAWTAVFKTDPNAPVAPGREKRAWKGLGYSPGKIWTNFFRTANGKFPLPNVKVIKNQVYNGSVLDGAVVEGAGVDFVNGVYDRSPYAKVNGEQAFYKKVGKPAKIFWVSAKKWCIGDGGQNGNAYYCSSRKIPT